VEYKRCKKSEMWGVLLTAACGALLLGGRPYARGGSAPTRRAASATRLTVPELSDVGLRLQSSEHRRIRSQVPGSAVTNAAPIGGGAAVEPLAARLEGVAAGDRTYQDRNHDSDAILASATGAGFKPEEQLDGELLRPAQAIKGLYAAFNARNATGVASFLTEDCVYEDLLLGPATVCRGKVAFLNALQYHPAFISSRLFDGLPLAHLLPSLTLEVDSIAEGRDTVGVEWHVQCGSVAFPLGRGLSQARVCAASGKIERVVDIAEAPWRVIGLLLLPFISAFGALSKALAPASPAAVPVSPAAKVSEPLVGSVNVEREYSLLLGAVLADGRVEPSERALLRDYAEKNQLSSAQHATLLKRAGWSEEEFLDGVRSRKIEQ